VKYFLKRHQILCGFIRVFRFQDSATRLPDTLNLINTARLKAID
jgi:hypothetical protein